MNARAVEFISGAILAGKGIKSVFSKTGTDGENSNWISIGVGTSAMISAANVRAGKVFNHALAITYAAPVVVDFVSKIAKQIQNGASLLDAVEEATKLEAEENGSEENEAVTESAKAETGDVKHEAHSQFIPDHQSHNRNNGHGRHHPHH